MDLRWGMNSLAVALSLLLLCLCAWSLCLRFENPRIDIEVYPGPRCVIDGHEAVSKQAFVDLVGARRRIAGVAVFHVKGDMTAHELDSALFTAEVAGFFHCAIELPNGGIVDFENGGLLSCTERGIALANCVKIEMNDDGYAVSAVNVDSESIILSTPDLSSLRKELREVIGAYNVVCFSCAKTIPAREVLHLAKEMHGMGVAVFFLAASPRTIGEPMEG